jgi:hypothetical protein
MTPGDSVDAKAVRAYLAVFRGVEVTPDEAEGLADYWNGLQALRAGAPTVPSHDVPIAVDFDPAKENAHGRNAHECERGHE